MEGIGFVAFIIFFIIIFLLAFYALFHASFWLFMLFGFISIINIFALESF
jgi:hypothetical protein